MMLTKNVHITGYERCKYNLEAKSWPIEERQQKQQEVNWNVIY